MSYYSNYGYESNDGGWGKIIAIIILLFFVAWGMDSCSVSTLKTERRKWQQDHS